MARAWSWPGPAHGWSGPSFIGLGGAGWGLQIGAELTDFIFVLNNDAAVRAFSRDGNFKLGADLSAAAGPVGRDLQAGVTTTAAVYTYSRSKGLFAGISLEGAIIGTQKTANDRYYGRTVGARSILAGKVPPPAGRGAVARPAQSPIGQPGVFALFALQSRNTCGRVAPCAGFVSFFA